MRTLGIDIETYSSADLKKCGVYKYVQAHDFTVLLFCYAVDNGPKHIIDLAQGETLPDFVLEYLVDPEVKKTAFNANFERVCLQQFTGLKLPASQWECTMAYASQLSLPLDLETAARVLKLEQQKDSKGKALIRFFSIPCKPTKANGQRCRNLPEHAPDKWEDFKNYCIADVAVEQAIRDKIAFFTIPQTEQKLYSLDQVINDRGILLDPDFMSHAIALNHTYVEQLTAEAIQLTGLSNPNSVAQLKHWLNDQTGLQVDKLSKEIIPDLLEQIDDVIVKRVIGIRQEMSKTSVKKYVAMTKAICSDNRVRGLIQYYGANRTGRWAGRIVQVHNLPRNEMEDLDLARQIVKQGNLELLYMLFDNVPDVLSQLIRTAFIASPDHRLIVADFSAIEARVIAWLANEKWRLDVFNTHGKIYEASASQMFKVPLEHVTKGSVLRQKGKMCELALGYQGGPAAVIRIEISNKTPKHKRIPEEELPKLVAMWRSANANIVRYWNKIGDAALAVVAGEVPRMDVGKGISMFMEKGIFFIELPSKRRLAYLRPAIRNNKYGSPTLWYEGMDQTTKKWCKQQTYGGKLVENIVQAIARDCLADALLRVDAAGYNVVMHVHDEIVTEVPHGKGSTEEINRIMGQPIPWASGLPLKADSYETDYYKKD